MKKKAVIILGITIMGLTACGSNKAMSSSEVVAATETIRETETASVEESQSIAETETASVEESQSIAETETASVEESQSIAETETASVEETQSIAETARKRDGQADKEPQPEEQAIKNYTLTTMDKEMQVTNSAKTYGKPNAVDVEKSVVQQNEVVTVIGKVDNSNWYKIKQYDGIESFIDGVYLSEVVVQPEQVVEQPQPEVKPEQPVVEQPQPEAKPEQPVVEQPSNDDNQPGYIGINPATGEQYKEGDVMPSGAIFSGDHSGIRESGNW